MIKCKFPGCPKGAMTLEQLRQHEMEPHFKCSCGKHLTQGEMEKHKRSQVNPGHPPFPFVTDSPVNPLTGDTRIWHIPQVPGEAFHIYVRQEDLPLAAARLVDALQLYDNFQYEQNVRPDFTNASGVETFVDGEWQEWYDSEDRDILYWVGKLAPVVEEPDAVQHHIQREDAGNGKAESVQAGVPSD